jgi:hypothetical protein
LRAGLEVDGVRGDKSVSSAAKSRTQEQRILNESCTFSPALLPRVDDSAAVDRLTYGGEEPAWRRLYALATPRREAQARAEEAAEAEAIASAGTFTPDISGRARSLQRAGFIEDRLISGWAEKLLVFEEKVAAERTAQEARTAAEARAALCHASSDDGAEDQRAAGAMLRRRVNAKRQTESVHEQLYAKAPVQRSKLDTMREEQRQREELLERWDGSALPAGEILITRRAKALGSTSRAPFDPSAAGGVDTPMAAQPEGEAAGATCGVLEAAHDRLHRRGSSLLRRTLEEEQSWQSVVAERMAGGVGEVKPRSARAEFVEAMACDRLYKGAQEHLRLQHERSIPISSRNPLAAAASNGEAVSVEAVPLQSHQTASRAEAEARGAQMYAEGLARQQHRDEVTMQARRDADAEAIERAHRTAGKTPVSAAKGGRLYKQGLEQLARQDRLHQMEVQQKRDDELLGTTFAPEISPFAEKLRTDGRSVEQRMMEWHEAKQARLAERLASSQPNSSTLGTATS